MLGSFLNSRPNQNIFILFLIQYLMAQKLCLIQIFGDLFTKSQNLRFNSKKSRNNELEFKGEFLR